MGEIAGELRDRRDILFAVLSGLRRGSVPFTRQVYAGVAWQPTDWVAVSVGYHCLSFQSASKTLGVEHLSLGGALLAGSCHF
jgi:hypothetical protein